MKEKLPNRLKGGDIYSRPTISMTGFAEELGSLDRNKVHVVVIGIVMYLSREIQKSSKK